MSAVAVKIAWDKSPDADRYAVYVRSNDGPFAEHETRETSVVLQIEEQQPTEVHVASRQGDQETISSEELRLYVTHW